MEVPTGEFKKDQILDIGKVLLDNITLRRNKDKEVILENKEKCDYEITPFDGYLIEELKKNGRDVKKTEGNENGDQNGEKVDEILDQMVISDKEPIIENTIVMLNNHKFIVRDYFLIF